MNGHDPTCVCEPCCRREDAELLAKARAEGYAAGKAEQEKPKPPSLRTALSEAFDGATPATVTEHCTNCDGGQVWMPGAFDVGGTFVPGAFVNCAECVNGRRTRPASSRESAVALDEDLPARYLGMVEDSERRLADALATEKAAHLATLQELHAAQAQLAAFRAALVDVTKQMTGTRAQKVAEKALYGTDAGKALLERLAETDARVAQLERAQASAYATNDALREKLATAERLHRQMSDAAAKRGAELAQLRAQVETLTKERTEALGLLRQAQRLADSADQGARAEKSSEWRIPWTRECVEVFSNIATFLAKTGGDR